jgi:cellulose biosynthesis protein BcsQ
MTEGSIVTFYSYKGGVGRTLALANVGALLCHWGYKVLCVDWDLEAPGLHLYFERWAGSTAAPDKSSQKPGLTELIQAHVDGARPNWREFLTEVRFPETDHPLQLMTAGRQDSSYIPRMQALDWQRLYEEHKFGNFLETLREEWKQEFDFVLVDSRTGITDIGGICTVQLPDLLVLLFTANLQSLRGSLNVVQRAKQVRSGLPFTRAKLLVLPVATRFEVRVEYELAQNWLKTFATELGSLYTEWAHRDVTAEELLNHTRIPYIPYWSFGEKLPVIEKGTEDPEDIGFSFETLAALIGQRFSDSDVLVRNRDVFVSTVRKFARLNGGTGSSGGQTGRGTKLFISYSHKDEKLLNELLTHLFVLQRQGIIESWTDRLIPAGGEWKEGISARLEEADLILLLVSSDYLASDYAVSVEMRRAIERQEKGEARVIPIILRDVDWTVAPFANLQVLPQDGKAVTNWPNRDSAWRNISEGIKRASEQLASRQHEAAPPRKSISR